MNLLNDTIWSPIEYAKVAILAQEAGKEMLSRLDWMTLKPKKVLDMGCGTGEMASRLKAYYGDAQVLGLDLSLGMLMHAKQRSQADNQLAFVCADGGKLPLSDNSVDLIFSNLLLPWHPEMPLLLREWRRVLRPQGLLMITALGLDTMQEWQTLFAASDMPRLIDMHDLGDLLLQEKFADPVLDVNHFTLSYRDQATLFQELQGSGMWFPGDKATTIQVGNAHRKTWEVTYEVIYAHAFMEANKGGASADGETRISLATLKKQLKKNE